MTRQLSFTYSHGPSLLVAALCTIALSVADAFFTLDLVGRGAEELNPIMAYYLEKSPLIFFSVKYLLTCATIILILSAKEICIFGRKLRMEILFACFILPLAAVIQWQLILLRDIAGY
jgi:hypothetical protein